jgi:hypothetical protein
VNDVAMSSEAAQQVAHTLNECVGLWMNQYLGDQILARVLNESLACMKKKKNVIFNEIGIESDRLFLQTTKPLRK